MPSAPLPVMVLPMILLLLAPGPSRRMPMSWRPMLGSPGSMLLSVTRLSRISFLAQAPTSEMPANGPLRRTVLPRMMLPFESLRVMPSPKSPSVEPTLSWHVMFSMTLLEPPAMATPAPKPLTVPLRTVTPLTLRRRMPGAPAAADPCR